MSLFGSLIGGAISAAVGTGVKAAQAANKKKNSSSGGGSSAKRQPSSGGASQQYGNITNNNTGTISKAIYDQYDSIARNAAAQWHNAKTEEEKAAWHKIAVDANTALGRSYNDSMGTWSGGFLPVQDSPYLQQTPQYQEQRGQEKYGWGNYEDSDIYRAYIKQIEEQQALSKAAMEQGKKTLEQQLPGIRQSYDDAARQAYIQYMNAKKDLPQQLAAAGISGQGAAESTISSQANTYNNMLSQSELARIQAEQQVQSQISNLEATGDLQYAQNAANMNQAALQAYENYLKQQQAAIENERSFALNLGAQTGFLQGMPTLNWQQQQASNKEYEASMQAQAYERQMQQYQQAFQRWQLTGKVLNHADAALLGVPVGTSTADERYNTAKIALQNYIAHSKV